MRSVREGQEVRAAYRWTWLAIPLLLAGCHNAPKGQVVAIVNGNEISIQQLVAELQDRPIPDSVDRAALRRLVLQDVIDRELLVEEARKQGLDKTPEFLAQKKRSDETLLAGILGHKVAQTVALPTERDVQDYIAAHPLQFAKRQRLTFDQLSFDPPRDRRRLAVLADAHTLEAAEAALQSIGIAAVRGKAAIDTGLTDPRFADAIARLPANEPILLPQGDRLIVGVITAREAIPVPSEVATVAAARAVRAENLLRESEAQIGASRAEATIHYEPGFEPDKPAPPAKR